MTFWWWCEQKKKSERDAKWAWYTRNLNELKLWSILTSKNLDNSFVCWQHSMSREKRRSYKDDSNQTESERWSLIRKSNCCDANLSLQMTTHYLKNKITNERSQLTISTNFEMLSLNQFHYSSLYSLSYRSWSYRYCLDRVWFYFIFYSLNLYTSLVVLDF